MHAKCHIRKAEKLDRSGHNWGIRAISRTHSAPTRSEGRGSARPFRRGDAETPGLAAGDVGTHDVAGYLALGVGEKPVSPKRVRNRVRLEELWLYRRATFKTAFASLNESSPPASDPAPNDRSG